MKTPTNRSRLGRELIISLYLNQNHTTAEIAKIAGYSTQRIGQILRGAGVDVAKYAREKRRATAQRKRATRLAQQEAHREILRTEKRNAKRRADIAQYQHWRALWAKGETAVFIAKFENRPLEAIKGTIQRLRKRYGWFHYRKPRRSV